MYLIVIIYGIPIVALFFFGFSLYNYLRTRIANKKKPDSFSKDEVKNCRIALIVSSAVLAVIVAVLVGLIVLLATAVAFM